MPARRTSYERASEFDLFNKLTLLPSGRSWLQISKNRFIYQVVQLGVLFWDLWVFAVLENLQRIGWWYLISD